VADTEQSDFTAMTVQLLSAYFSNNQVPADEIAGIIEATRGALERKAQVEAPPVAPDHVPAVSIRKSLGSREHIISMLDGKPYKTLKRHLAVNGLTPAEYRERYNLPMDYPMVAPAYSEQRRIVAQKLGLGRRVGAKTQATAPGEEASPVEEAAPVVEATPVVEAAPVVEAVPTPSSPQKPKRGRVKATAAEPDAQQDIVPVEAKPEPVLPEMASAKPTRKTSTSRKSPRASTKTSPASQEVTPAPMTVEAVKSAGKTKTAAKVTKPKASASPEAKATRRRTLKLNHVADETPTKATAE